MSFIGHKIVGNAAKEGVYQAGHYGWFYIYKGLTWGSFDTEAEAQEAFRRPLLWSSSLFMGTEWNQRSLM